ncbi:MAG: dehydrogenase (ubiquinone) 30 kda subunit, partial [Ilumatobacteraceae bacterium]|nr:dehydrogenase (ubiquinone) 30 kda subunit [Ilumatobacteraceae bacterium]
RWVEAVTTARELLRCLYFERLRGDDELAEGFEVVCNLCSVEQRHGLLIRTHVPLAEPTLDTLTDAFAGAGWHERETFEMFGIVFAGHNDLRNMYLPSDFEGYPLRKDFPLLSRIVKPWPGIVDVEPLPGEDEADEADEAEAPA